MQIFIFSVVQKLWPNKAFKNTPTSLTGVKKSLQRKYGFMVLTETVLRHRLRNQSPFQNIMLLACEIMEKTLEFDKYYGKPMKWCIFLDFSGSEYCIFKWTLVSILFLKSFSESTMNFIIIFSKMGQARPMYKGRF